MHKIVIVGGGAGGLELATKLGDTLGKRKKLRLPLLIAQKRMYGSHCFMKLLPEV